jgi:two-component system sensor histidine kinase RegB
MHLSHNSIVEPPRQHLRQLTIIRSLLLAFFWCGFLTVFLVDKVNLPYKEVVSVLCVFNAVHFFTFFRLRQALAVTNTEFFIQLLIDVVCLNVLFYFSGGATNPFVSYLLVPVCISAATLPWRFTWFITALCVVAYTLLLFFHVTLPIFAIDHMHVHSQLNWHILGMWFNFFVSATLVTYFVVKMARTLREQEKMLNELREDELSNEQVIAVATLAAGAAHEINTPLATMTVLLAELRSEYQHNQELTADLNLLTQQVEHCAASLKQMVQDSSAATKGEHKQQNIKTYCNSIIDRWQLVRPEVNFTLRYSGDVVQQSIAYDSRLDHAIINLLNNAADASPTNIARIRTRCSCVDDCSPRKRFGMESCFYMQCRRRDLAGCSSKKLNSRT